MTPAECSLLIAVPLDRQELESALERDSEFLRFNGQSKATAGEYLKKSRTILRILKRCRRLGAHVVTGATLTELRDVTEGSRAVALVAHMDFPNVRDDEIEDWKGLIELVEGSVAPEFQALRHHLRGDFDIPTIVAGINALIDLTAFDLKHSGPQGPEKLEQAVAARKNPYGMLRFDRLRFEELLGPAILRPRPCVELADGMYHAQAIVDAVRLDFHGFLDLSLCQSMPLGARVSRARPRLSGRIGVGKTTIEADAAVKIFHLTMWRMVCRRPRITYYQAKEELIGRLI